ncbi:MAG: hypothetical protein BMS9Abin05_0486 [Rhodothermia bacterium]|nr:MAG: hypothetical protein BMS9Abin05_0486 [Rhodothermia bacterium]
MYKKALYCEYTDETFTTLKPRAPEWEHLGILGPLIRAEVGDTIVVLYKNNASFPSGLHPHGVFYDKDSEGAPYVDETKDLDKADDSVPTSGTHTYVWPVPERAGPAEGDGSSALWMYHSHTEEVKDVNAALFGPMIVTGKGASKSDGSPIDVDREYVITLFEVGENESHYRDENIQTYTSDPDGQEIFTDPFGGPIVISPDPGMLGDYNLMESLNGFVYGNLPGVTMNVGEHVRWYVMASTNFEVHAPHWHGNTVEIGKMRSDVGTLPTMGMLIADMVPDNPGKWLFHCHVAPHLQGGMVMMYDVQSPALAAE